jgi:DNA-binding NarL/FixJ family response regulator
LTPKVFIIGDEDSKTLFGERYNARLLTQEDTLSGETVVLVDAHSRQLATDSRSSLAGLRMLEKYLAEWRENSVPIHVFGWVKTEDLKQYQYLIRAPAGVRYHELPELPDDSLLYLVEYKKERQGELCRLASEHRTDYIGSAYRHNLKSVTAAARLFLGAAVAGAVPPAKIEPTLVRLERRAGVRPGALDDARKDLSQLLQTHQMHAGDYENVQISQVLRVWMLDDHWTDHGWEDFLQSLFHDARGFTTWDELRCTLEQCAAASCQPDVILLDCNLGNDPQLPTGFRLIRPFKRSFPDIKLVFMTGFDDAKLAVDACCDGADAFFAKQLHDEGDRSSIQYFQHFMEVIRPSPLFSNVAEWWRHIHGYKAELEPEQLSAARWALALGFSAANDNAGRFSMGVEQALMAMTSLLKSSYVDPENNIPKTWSEGAARDLWLSAGHGSLKSGLWKPANFSEMLVKLLGPPRRAVREPFTLSRSDESIYRHYSQHLLQTDSDFPGIEPRTLPQPVAIRESASATELIRGWLCSADCTHGTESTTAILNAHEPVKMEPIRVALLDDNAGLNGWTKALQALLTPECVIVHASPEDFLASSGADVLILDLMLPTWTRAKNALAAIRARYPTLPILALGQSDDSPIALRAMQMGADIVLTRALPYPRATLADCRDFAEEFAADLRMLKLFSPSRYADYANLVAGLPRSWPWPSGSDPKPYRRSVDAIKRQIFNNEVRATVPPSPEELSSFLKRQLSLVLHLWWRAMCIWIHVPGRSHSGEPIQRDYRLRALNDSSFDEITKEQHSIEPLVRLAAIMSGALVEELAIWNRSLLDKTPVDRRMWGSTLSGSFNIRDEIVALGAGERAWTLRVEALGKRASTRAWDIGLFPQLLDAVEASIHRFVENRTRGAQNDSSTRPCPI